MIFKTIDDNNSLSGQRIVSKFTARKIAQEEATKQLEIDIQCLVERCTILGGSFRLILYLFPFPCGNFQHV